jgi:hypothetical protein
MNNLAQVVRRVTFYLCPLNLLNKRHMKANLTLTEVPAEMLHPQCNCIIISQSMTFCHLTIISVSV